VTAVRRWSGREVRALRQAKRMSLRAFAAHLGVSERMISKWEAGGQAIHPRPVNQAALDTSLACSSAEVQHRFRLTIDAETILDESPGAALTSNEPNQTRHPVDGRLMTLVPAGVYLSGTANDPVWLPAYYIDVFPVTNADYARFVAATGHKPPDLWERGRCPDNLFDHPVVFVTWGDAAAYANWAAKSLPTSQQWEKAARGDRGDVYPWGSQMTPAKCNVRENRVGHTTPVSCYQSGVSPYGVFDMCGNVWEWCSTQTEPERYELKGAAFTSPFARATPSTFNDASIHMMDDDTGFRCATSAEDVESLLNAAGR
jgi:transcriptional regulator with XRE-family HTH domain